MDFGAGISHQTGGNSRKDEKIAAGTASLSGAGVLIRVPRCDNIIYVVANFLLCTVSEYRGKGFVYPASARTGSVSLTVYP